MSDISTIWSATRGDWKLSGVQLASGNDLLTAMTISLFTDRVAADDDVIPDGSGDPRGWWADDPGAPIGSRLWLIARSKRTQGTLALAQGYIQEALQWMIDDGVVAKFDILVEWLPGSQLSAQIVAKKADGNVVASNFQWAWQQLR